MKQRFFKLLLGVAVFCLLAGSWVLAIQQPNECCKLRADVTITKEQGFTIAGVTNNPVTIPDTGLILENGKIIGNEARGTTMPFCDLDDDNVQETPDYFSKAWGMVCFLGTLNVIIKWLFIIIMLVVTIMIIYGGFLFVTAAGDPDRASRGKKVLMYAAIGLAVALLARVIPSVVRFIIGV